MAKLKRAHKSVNYIIVLHNYCTTTEDKSLRALVFDFIRGCFPVKQHKEQLEDETDVEWYENIDGTMRHVFIGKEGTAAGEGNLAAFKLVRSWIR